MKNLIKCHLNYLISKTTILVSFIVLFIILIVNITSVFTLDKHLKYSENNYLYFYNGFLIAKIIIVIFAVFIFGYSFTSIADQYIIILIASGISRIKIILTKLQAIALVVLVIIYISYFQYLIIGFIFYNEFIFVIAYLNAYLALYLIACFFGLMSMLLILIFDNIYTIIIPFALMNLSEIINEDKGFIIKIMNFLIPNYSAELYFQYGCIHVIILIIILSVVNVYFYKIKDLKS